MYFDRLNEIYTMVHFNWHFDNITQTGLTGLYDRSDRFAQIVQQTRYLPILGVNSSVPEELSWNLISILAMNNLMNA